mmetsp:Transcript_65676/g.154525  ORF Transcript_65676/g.154525 Transcript_65676/m.154525 type:complete len:227 (+) Transcript_65676:67-747(+)
MKLWPKSKPKTPRSYQVILAASELGPYVPGLGQAYHTSILVDNVEYEFGGAGINVGQGPVSHRRFCRGHEMIHLGSTKYNPQAMMSLLKNYFQPGTYDMLRKNCNSFTSCCLHFLLGKSMDPKYTAMEGMASSLDSYTYLVRMIMPDYQPNPFAEGFSVPLVCTDINLHQEMMMQEGAAKTGSWALLWRLQRKAKAGRELLRNVLCGGKTAPGEPDPTKGTIVASA